MALTPDQIKNLPSGENVFSVLFRKNLTANKNAGAAPKVGYQGSTELPSVTLTRKKLGKSIPKVEGEEPINTPRVKNYVEKPPWQKLGIYEANDIYSTLKDMYRQYDLGKVVHPGLAMGALFSPALTASAIPFLFQGENFRNKLKELSEKYQPEALLNSAKTVEALRNPGQFLGQEFAKRIIDIPVVKDTLKGAQQAVLQWSKVPAQLFKEQIETSNNLKIGAWTTPIKLFDKSKQQKQAESFWRSKADSYIAAVNETVAREEFRPDNEIAAAVGGVAFSMAAGVITAIATKSPVAAGAMFGAVAKGAGYERAREAGVEPSKASIFSTAQGVAEGALEAAGLHLLLKPTTGLVGVAKKMLTEATQESSQEVAGAAIAATGGYEDRTLDAIAKDVVLSAAIGAVMGGAVGVGVDLATERKTISEVQQAYGVTKQDAKKIVADILPSFQKILASEGGFVDFSKKKTSQQEKVLTPQEKLAKAIRSEFPKAKKLRAEQEILYTEARGKAIQKATAAYKKAGGGESGLNAWLKAMQGELPKKTFVSLRDKFNQEELDNLINIAAKHPELDKFKQKATAQAIRELITQGKVPGKAMLATFDDIYGRDISKAIRAQAGIGAKVSHFIGEVARTSRTFMTIGEASMIARQNLIATVSKPLIAVRAVPSTFKSLTKKGYKAELEKIKKMSTYELMNKFNVPLTAIEGSISKQEEPFQSFWAEKTPIIGKYLVKPSERIFTTYSNIMRAEMFNKEATKLLKQGYTPLGVYKISDKFREKLVEKLQAKNISEEKKEELADKLVEVDRARKEYKDLINNIFGNKIKVDFNKVKPGGKAFKDLSEIVGIETGRSSLPKGIEKHADLLNTGFFAARLQSSRIKAINPYTYVRLHPAVRKILLKDVLTTLAVGLAALWGLKKKGYTVEADPRSSDFGKIKVGNTRIDIWGGHGQYVRLIYQLASGEIKNVNSGVVRLLGKKGGDNRADVVFRFLRGKVSPGISAAWDVLAGTTVVGEEVTPQQQAASKFLPIFWQDLYEAYRSTGSAEKTILTTGFPGFFGVGSQTYEPKISDYSEDVKGNRVNWYESKDSIELFKTMPGGEDFYNITSVYKDQYKKYKTGKADAPDKEVYRNLVETVLKKAIIPQARGENKENWEALLEIHKVMNDGKMEWNAYRKLVTKLREGDKVIASYPSSIWN